MPQQQVQGVENNFGRGLITESTGLNFPENACTDTQNCEFALDGSVRRRLGFDFEIPYTTKQVNRATAAMSNYLWKTVGGNGDLYIEVVQVGATIYFYEVLPNQSFSQGDFAAQITLTAVAGAPIPDTVECQYTDGNGLLFITHPYCDPVYVSYDQPSHTATKTTITLQIRDFIGAIADNLAVTTRPTTAATTTNHLYNLYNQGWNTANLNTWNGGGATVGTYPSNADVMWTFRDASNNFSVLAADVNRVVVGNTPAPNGHFILTLSNQDRNTAAGVSGVASTTTSYWRPSTACFFAGRVFYSGINYTGFNTNIYFSQIVEQNNQYGYCYQTNDPTGADLQAISFDLLPSDGGVISIPEAGTIYKLFAVSGGLAVFGARGVWFITGSSGLGFTANDYVVIKVADIPTISATSFVNVSGNPAWLNEKGAYILAAQGNSAGLATGPTLPVVQSLSDDKIKTFYANIPLSCKKFAKGMFHYFDGHIRWIYRSTATSNVQQIYEYDRVLCFNTLTGAFYTWTLPNQTVKVNGITVSELVAGTLSVVNVIDGSGNQVVDGAGNNVIVFVNTGTERSPFDKYLVSYQSGGNYFLTFADKNNESYVDFAQFDGTGVNFTSYIVAGYKLMGGGIRKFQANWVRVFSKLLTPVQYFFQGIWDYANTGSATGKFSQKQIVKHDNLSYTNASRRLKVRGHGLALQFKVSSVDGQPFEIIGWSGSGTVNQLP